MCGIAGTAGFGNEDLARAMADTIAHRGPDGGASALGTDPGELLTRSAEP